MKYRWTDPCACLRCSLDEFIFYYYSTSNLNIFFYICTSYSIYQNILNYSMIFSFWWTDFCICAKVEGRGVCGGWRGSLYCFYLYFQFYVESTSHNQSLGLFLYVSTIRRNRPTMATFLLYVNAFAMLYGSIWVRGHL